jgi:methionine-S-sulfoxide reductase
MLSSKLRHLVPITLAAAMIAVVAWQPWATSAAAEDAVVIPAPAVDEQPGPRTTETAVLAGGCFWGVQGVFQHVDGVTRAVSGYAGGEADAADYQTVGQGTTGHAESVEITFDPTKISYGKILQIYFSVAHDPTQFNYQGPDMGPQYRSAIFSRQRRAGARRESLHRPARPGARLWRRDRHDHRARPRLLSGRGLSPGLPDAESDLSLHRDQRPAEGREPEAPLPGTLSR